MIVLTLFGYFNNLKLYLLRVYQHSVIPTKSIRMCFLFYRSLNLYFANEVDGKTLP